MSYSELVGAQTLIPLDNYLSTSVEGIDREFHHGTLMERSLPDYLHGKIQLLLGAFFL
jgi:hypothetical protein